MKILFYTQETSLGGSTRLLLNLARYLSRKHEVTFSFPNQINSQGMLLFDYFSEIKKIPQKHLIERNDRFDAALFHLPYGVDDSLQINCSKKIAVLMEIATEANIMIANNHTHLFDKIIYLHEEQIKHLDKAIIGSKIFKLNIINNIDYYPEFSKTGNLGCVGSLKKHNLQEHLKILRSTRGLNKLIVYSNYPLTAKKIGLSAYIWREIFYKLRKLEFRGLETVTNNIYSAFDCLLHTPSHGNGTSVVVSDALASGKYVVLSPLPEYKKAYKNSKGVFFLDKIGYNLSNLIQSYNQVQHQSILNAYGEVYDRNAILKEWESAITES